MHLFLSLSGIVLSSILLYFNARNNRSTIYLGILFLMAGAISFTHYILLDTESVNLAAVVMLHSGIIPLLGGPLLYFYIRSVLSDNPKLVKSDLVHLLPVLLLLAFSSPYLFSSWTFKKEVAGKLLSDLNSKDYLDTGFLGSEILVTVVFIVSKVVFLAYTLWCLKLLVSFLRDKREKQVLYKLQSTITWIRWFLVLVLIMVIAHILFMVKIFAFGDLRGLASIKFIQNIIGLGPLSVLLLTFFSPDILYGLPRIPARSREVLIPEKPADLNIPTGKATQKQLESEYLQSIGLAADTCMEKSQPYINPGFNQAELSVLIHIPVHHLGYYFREIKKQSFTDYRNEWRVKHAKDLIMEGKTGEMTLEAIGMLSGFPNRDSFRTAFQRIEGISPATFITRKQE